MKRVMSFTIIVGLLWLFSAEAVQAQVTGVGFRIIFQDNSLASDTGYFGWLPGFTYCIDTPSISLPQFGVMLTEQEIPPLPPDGVLDLRFVDSRSGSGSCLGQGVDFNFHGCNSTLALDTFRINFQGSGLSGGALPYKISWVLPTSVVMQINNPIFKYTDPDDGPVIVSMFDSNSVTITKDGISRAMFVMSRSCPSLDVGAIQPEFPGLTRLFQNYPNPFNPNTEFRYSLATAGYVTLKIYDVLGREMETIQQGLQEPGLKSIPWSGDKLASGLYFYRLTVVSQTHELQYSEMKKMVLIR